jgi:SAM-dependent methyltransferase
MTVAVEDRTAAPLTPLPGTERSFRAINDARRDPVPTQFDYLHLRYLLAGIKQAIASLDAPPRRVLDVFCGTRPYEHLIGSDSTYTALDVTDYWGVADVVTSEFLPFEDDEFDLALFTEGFYYLSDPARGASELARVLRPGGLLVLTVPYAWEYERGNREHRFTETELWELFRGWDGLEVSESGGRGVAWATMTGRILDLAEQRWNRRISRKPPRSRRLFQSAYLTINAAGMLMDRVERRLGGGPTRFPMNLLLTARAPDRPPGGADDG